MLEIRKGSTTKPASSARLVNFFKENSPQLNGYLYIGYPILFAGGESVTIDALWVSPEKGVVVFDIVEGAVIGLEHKDLQDKLYSKLTSQLVQYPELNKNRKFIVNVDIVTYAPAVSESLSRDFKCAISEADLISEIDSILKWEHSDLYNIVVSVFQSVVKLKSSDKRLNVKKIDSRGAKVKRLEDTIANLDQEQERAVIESFDGLQRIRGLAGSGKTIVLALKAAYLHAQHPDWNIAVTFNTRALKNQFRELITRFYVSKKGELPDWEKLKIVQSWGSPKNHGIYYEFCKENNIEYFDLRKAMNYSLSIGQTQKPFENICAKALSESGDKKELFDAILVDEAQDLSESFLKICFNMLKEPKRLIYAYDELQKLNEGSSLGTPMDIFGRDAEDTILHKCYRNSRPLLVTAHALGFGIYRDDGLVQFFDQPQLWSEVGYHIKEGRLEAGCEVSLERTNETSPQYLEEHSGIEDMLIFKTFASSDEQACWIAKEIENNINYDELLHKDIIVINPVSVTTKREVALIRSLLLEKNINCHIAGEINADVFFEESSVAFTGINRAKGNEVPMVYIINADACYAGTENENLELIKKRNILFTAITRSKAWVRVSGIGDKMNKLIEEYEKVKTRGFELHFSYPTDNEIKRMNLIHRDITGSEKQKIKSDVNTFKIFTEILARIKSGESHIEDYPKQMQEILNELNK